jgi:hypothetical protein
MWGLLTAAVPAVGPVWGPDEADKLQVPHTATDDDGQASGLVRCGLL